MGVQASLAVLVLIMGTITADEGDVSFWMVNFTLTCPKEGKWFYKGVELQNYNGNKSYKVAYDARSKGLYHCEYIDVNTAGVKYYFYVEGKVCLNCFELDARFFAGVIAADMAGTAVLMAVVYRCTRKKSSSGQNFSKSPARSGGRAPPGGDSEYEKLRTHNRSQDEYSFLNS